MNLGRRAGTDVLKEPVKSGWRDHSRQMVALIAGVDGPAAVSDNPTRPGNKTQPTERKEGEGEGRAGA